VKINPAVPVYWVYVTAWGTPDGITQFREDIYQRDGLNAPREAELAPAVAPAALPAPVTQAAAPRTMREPLLPRDEEN
jgi:hypothetical protein